MIKAVMFDLDGTLLPMDQDVFIKMYFGNLAKKMAQYGLDPQKLINAVGSGTKAMVKNDGQRTNEECFWKVFDELMGIDHRDIEDKFTEFYMNEFKEAKKACGCNTAAKELIQLLKDKGYRLICATNPLFPRIATQQRIQWAGLDPNDFELFTTFEFCHYAKPNLKYYEEILEKCGLNADEVIMVGNDVEEDLVVQQLGIKAHLITDDLINRHNKEYSAEFVGSMVEFIDFIRNNY